MASKKDAKSKRQQKRISDLGKSRVAKKKQKHKKMLNGKYEQQKKLIYILK